MTNTITTYLRLITPNDTEKFLMTIGGFLGAWFSDAIGGFDKGVVALLILVGVDYVLGTFAALKTGQWSSKQGFQGLFKKVFIFVMVMACHCVDQIMNLELFRSAIIFAYAVNELGSIIESADKVHCGNLVPAFLRRGIKVLKEKEEHLLDGKLK